MDQATALAEITRLAAELNQLDDALGKLIADREHLLVHHNPGTRVSFGVFAGGEIRWAKLHGHWRFTWTSDDGTIPLTGAPRHVRAAFSPIIDDTGQLLMIVLAALENEIKIRRRR